MMLTLSMNCILLSTKRNIWSLTLNAFHQLLIASDSIYILHAYLQGYIWLHSAYLENIDLDPLEYGYRLTANRKLVPIISTKLSIPCNFPQPCNCQKCSKASVCKFWLLEIHCYQFCKCGTSPQCKMMLRLNWIELMCVMYIDFVTFILIVQNY